MTTHQLARYLLESTPDLPVVVNGWDDDWDVVDTECEVTGAALTEDGGKVFLGHGRVDTEWAMLAPRLP